MREIQIGPNPVTGAGGNGAGFEALGWRHRITATLGFDTASFSIMASQDVLEEMFYYGLGRKVVRYSLDGNSIAWEGFISTMTLTLPGISFSVSLRDVGNSVTVRYTPLDTTVSPPAATTSTTRTSAASDAQSQARYGNKDLILSGGQTTVTQANQIRDLALAEFKNPKRASEVLTSSNEISLKVSCEGYVHTLDWQVYNQVAVTGTQNANLAVSDIVTTKGQFVASTKLDANTTAIPKYTDMDRSALDLLQSIASQGDSSGNRWLIQVLEDRKLYYRAASVTLAYWYRVRDNRREFISAAGDPVAYELVRPDRWLKVSDVASFATTTTTLASDLSAMYIESVEWTEESDDLNLQGSPTGSLQTLIARSALEGKRVL